MLTNKCLKIMELRENFSHERRRGIPMRWWRWCTLVRNRERHVLLVNPLTIHVFLVTNRCDSTATNRKGMCEFDKRFIIQGDIEMVKKKGNKMGI